MYKIKCVLEEGNVVTVGNSVSENPTLFYFNCNGITDEKVIEILMSEKIKIDEVSVKRSEVRSTTKNSEFEYYIYELVQLSKV